MSINVTLHQLRAFTTVARTASFTRAAQRLALSQPALSIAVRQVEEQLGVTLFDRTTRRVTLTPEGEDFLPTAERLLHDFDTAISDIRAIAERRRGRVALSALPSVAIRLLPPIVARFTERYPGISVHLRDDNASGVQHRVRRNEADFGIGSAWQPDPELEFTSLVRDRVGLVCRSDHPLAESTAALPWSALARYTFLGLGRDTGIRPLLESAGALPDCVLSPHFEVSNIATLSGMLEAGLGVTALPRLAVLQEQHPHLVFRELTAPALERQICIITRRARSLSPAAHTLRELIREHVAESA
ncbi:MAG: LysR family transcriptional regulator [Gammaproteobacteria bacterium]|nr:LysR family transcriptional regulator [Gammaproteobacteria bacterium]NIR81680.1 LysR family transcriptional regulator [Gammaproteobacteria bacterium]NIR88243.1 LysR family transcriptional regulator [Gammaproteobacteria bacterium]NIU02782.1 LysR family transcriptional regulator [Gammaproteobacteria bacterium]NIV50306.1 LysR family transcriptional regulator [Gammaproteobacteria bacterium]